MKSRFLKAATGVSLPVLLALCALPAFSAEVTFTTTGNFCAVGPCATGDNFLQIGTFPQETYIAEVPVFESVPVGSTNVPFINFVVSAIGSTPRVGTGSFTIDIQQTSPVAGEGFLNDTLSGNFAVGSTTATLTFTDSSVEIGGVVYTLNSPTFTFATIGPPTHLDTILGSVTAATTTAPEPGFFALTGLALIGIAVIGYRRRGDA